MRQKENVWINNTRAYRKAAREVCRLKEEGGVLNSQQLIPTLHMHFFFYLAFFSLALSLCQGNSCVCFLYLSRHRKSSTLCFYKLYSQRDNTSRIKTIPQTIKNFCLLQVTPAAKTEVSKFGPWRQDFHCEHQR